MVMNDLDGRKDMLYNNTEDKCAYIAERWNRRAVDIE